MIDLIEILLGTSLFSIMGLNLGERGQFELAFRYQDLADELCAKYPNTFGATRGMNGIAWCNMHTRSHPREIVDYCMKAIQCGKNCGDLYNAGLSYGPLMWNLQVQGSNFLDIEAYAQECLQFSTKNHLSFSVGLAEAVLAGWTVPMKLNYVPVPMEEQLAKWSNDNHVASAGSYFVLLGTAHFYLGEYPQADVCFRKVCQFLNGLTDNVLKRQWIVFRILNSLRLEGQHAQPGWGELTDDIESLLVQVETWSVLGPLLKPYVGFIYAEWCLARGRWREARNAYMDAIELAHQLGYVFLEGHLYECLGELLQSRKAGVHSVCYRQALVLYRACHAERKEQLLLAKHWQHIQEAIAKDASPAPEIIDPGKLPDLDMNYLMKSALAISAEIDLEQLLVKIMTVVLECSGAQHGYLLVKETGDLLVLAESHVANRHENGREEIRGNAGHTISTGRKQLAIGSDVCEPIVNFVFRTREKVNLKNACAEGLFNEVAEVQELGLRSVLCLPVIKHGQLIGVLYLENRLADGVFTTDKSGMIELLTTHAAISLENAQLFRKTQRAEEALRSLNEALEQRVAEEAAKNREKDLLLIQQSRLAGMGEMIGNIAHQWRQPLNALGLVLNNVQEAYELNELDDSMMEKAMRDSWRLIKKMSDTINDFRDFFRPGKVKERFSLSASIQGAIDLVDASFRSDNIFITLETGDDCQQMGFANEYSQVLLNVLNNSREAIISSGIKNGIIKIRVIKNEDFAHVIIEDNGGGIPNEVIGKIFDPYFSTKDKGTGIGLYMSKMIIQTNMGGRIEAHSNASGAEFEIITPLHGGELA